MSNRAEQLVGSGKVGKLFVLSAPAGTGKTTLIKRLTAEFPSVIQSISYTSRKKRPQEISGVDYHFVSPDFFEKKMERDEFLEHAKVYDDYYGTDRLWVEEQLGKGKHVFLVIDTQGAAKVKARKRAILIFLFPPSMEELSRRLTGRKTENPMALETRLKWAEQEMQVASFYDYHIVNDNIDVAYEVLRSIVIAVDHNRTL